MAKEVMANWMCLLRGLSQAMLSEKIWTNEARERNKTSYLVCISMQDCVSVLMTHYKCLKVIAVRSPAE